LEKFSGLIGGTFSFIENKTQIMKICDIASSSNSPLNFKKLKLTYILRSVDILRSGYILSPWENTSVG